MATKSEFSGSVRSAELAEPLKGAELLWTNDDGLTVPKAVTDEEGRWKLTDVTGDEIITFAKDGFISKSYRASEIPELVRLLETQLIGYQDKLWFEPGEVVDAKIHSPEEFTARLYRHGLKKEQIEDLGAFPAQVQEVPDRFFVKDGLDWESSLSYRIPEDAHPGLYSLLLKSKKAFPFAIPLVVSTPPENYGNAKLLVLASTNNWQSYNIWGGRSRYRNYEEQASEDFLREPGKVTEWLAAAGKHTPRPLVRAVKKVAGMDQNDAPWKFRRLSVKRPFTNASLEQEDVFQSFTNHLAAGEWRVLAWLEREGYNYDIVTGYELHQNPDLLQHYEGIILSTHSEYWSRAMYEGLKKFHMMNGLWIVNLSGNSIYREIDFFEDGSHRCTSLKFEQSVEDETRLLGVRFTEGDYGTCAPYKVEKEAHWIFEHLPLRDGDLFGINSLNCLTYEDSPRYNPGRPGIRAGLKGTGASGWETDKLSRSAPDDFVRVGKGQNPRGGADMVIKEPKETRGGVFSASSITFGGALLIDPACSHITKNVLERVLAQ